MEVAKLVLEYLKVLLSPQLIAGGIAAAFLWIFRPELRSLFNRIAKIKLPGGTELSASQIDRSNEELPAKGEQPKPLPAESSEVVALPSNLTLSPEHLQTLEEAFAAERARAFLWEYRYLNYFLARSSQRALDWLAGLSVRTTIPTFDAFWLPIFPNAQERQAIVTALQAHYLIILVGEVIEVTPKGREYLQWRGPLPDEVA